MAWSLLVVLVVGCTVVPAEGDGAVSSPTTVPTAAPSEDGTGGSLRIGLSLDPVSIDPRFVADDAGETIVGALFEPLVALDARHQVVPAAARRWEIDDDGRRLTFHLREASFHDGSPVTAEAFVRSFTRLLDGTAEPRSYLGYLLEPVEGAAQVQEHGGQVSGLQAIDDHTLQIRLTSAQPGFLAVLADPSLVPLPVAAETDLEAFAAQPIGNGPFAMTEPRELGQFLRLTRFAEHHRPPELDEVVFSVYPDSGPGAQQWDDLVAGQLHVAEIPPERLDEAREQFGQSSDGYTGPGVLDGITSTVYLYGFDTTQPPFDDVRVRRALSLSIDRDRLARRVSDDARVAAFGIVPPSVPGSQARACAYCRHDPEQARALWEEVVAERRAEAEPAPDPTEGADPEESPAEDADEPTADLAMPDDLARITLTHNRGRTHSVVAERMASDIESALAITVDLEALDLAPFLQGVRSQEVAFFRIGWESGTPDPGAYLTPLFHSRGIGGDNLTGYAAETVDALLDEARSLAPPAAARARYREAERLILRDQPVMPLLWYRQSRVVAPGVQGLRWTPFGRIDLAAVSFDES